MAARLVLITVPDAWTGERLSKGLVGGKLAACVNRIPGVRSRYRWKGRIETAREELLLVKTDQRKLGALTRWVRRNHPYTVCEVIAVPIQGGNRPYLEWIAESLR